MINYWETLALYIAVTCLIFTVIGFINPVIMLWWEDVQNRKKVLKYYTLVRVLTNQKRNMFVGTCLLSRHTLTSDICDTNLLEKD